MLGARAWVLERALIRSQLGLSWLSGFQCEVILEGRFDVLGGEWLSVCAWGVHLSALGWLAYGFSHSADLVGYGAHVEAIFELAGEGWESTGRVLDVTVALAFMGYIYCASV
jgi:hypothetical protein